MRRLAVIGLETPQYRRHMTPVLNELERRGIDHLVDEVPWRRYRPDPDVVTLVAGWGDADRARRGPVIYLAHGVGQTYVGVDKGLPGASGLGHVEMFLSPSERVADVWRHAYPKARVVVAGDPALDGLRQSTTVPDDPLIAVTCHWRQISVPEAAPALPLYFEALGQLSERRRLLGHAHPRMAPELRRVWDELDIEYDPDPDSVLNRADAMIADSTSFVYQAAALGRPVLCLNAPTYRRDVEHGLRFWSHVPGLQCDDPADLEAAVERMLNDPPEARALRASARAVTYPILDHGAASRAADAVIATLCRMV